MDITFFIGNGFDLSRQLETSYIDFYKFLVDDQKIKKRIKKDNYFLEAIKKFMIDTKDINVTEDDASDVDWADFEKALGQYTINLKNETESEKYLNDLDDFRFDFIEYIDSQQNNYTVTEDMAKKMFEKLRLNFYIGIEKQNEIRIKNLLKSTNNPTYYFNFVNFNYTDTLNNIIKFTKQINDSNNGRFICREPIHVHRKLRTGAFLGVNDISQISNPDVFKERSLRDIIKPELQNYDDGTIPKTINSLINKTQIYFIFGMSMGVTDKLWWEKIATQVISNSNKFLIINKYLNDEDKGEAELLPRQKRIFKDKVIDEFLNNLELSKDQQTALLDRTFVILGSKNIFEL
ncbi:AbiH family protein [Staphylococcus edaphicus]|uniref:Bacteriophage abortive infection AbiH family protein n=1 Tax=Staphylococcus edaphicus TaxID=1955013 RepID=A0A2C6WNH4_9STAP|nr:AbiH family protein [Staphylococcus edaphicus]PHK50640.1 hypothetical protein BTJ66_02040 [Staphylococcus edaphicus]UQW80688.1 bacteriophage abortive infection AbiH family protein [Staphylococcus edaphicus]